MILPIVAYGHPVLKKKCTEIDEMNEEVTTLISNMWETMYNAQGVGLAAPQIGKAIRLFMIDTTQAEDDKSDLVGVKKVFINAQIIDESGKKWSYEEGCLSIPNIRADVERLPEIRIRYQDDKLNTVEEKYDGINARVIQHEYDHIEGILFTTKIKPLKKRLIKRKLEAISSGKIDLDYRMKFYRG